MIIVFLLNNIIIRYLSVDSYLYYNDRTTLREIYTFKSSNFMIFKHYTYYLYLLYYITTLSLYNYN